MNYDRRAQRDPRSLVNFQCRERNGAFGLAARVGESRQREIQLEGREPFSP